MELLAHLKIILVTNQKQSFVATNFLSANRPGSVDAILYQHPMCKSDAMGVRFGCGLFPSLENNDTAVSLLLAFDDEDVLFPLPSYSNTSSMLLVLTMLSNDCCC